MSEFDEMLPKVEMPTEQTSAQTEETKVDDTNTEETKQEETKVEANDETSQAEASGGKTEEKTEPSAFSFDSFRDYSKEKFEIDIESEDDIKTYFEKAKRVDELDEQVKSSQEQLAQLKALASKGLNGIDWFANEDEFVRQQMIKKNQGELSETALKVLSDLSPKRIEALDPVKAIEANMLLNNPDLSKDEVTALINAEYEGLEDGLDSMYTAARAKLKVNANASKKALGQLFEGIEIPTAVDFEAQLAARKEAWESPVKTITEGIDKLQLTEDFAFDVKPEMKAGLESELLSYALTSGADIGEESGKQIAGMARSLLLERNIDKIMKAYGDDIREQEREAIRQKVHNDKPLNSDKRPQGDSDGVLTGKEFMDKFL